MRLADEPEISKAELHESEHVGAPQTHSQSRRSSTRVRGEACPTGLDSTLQGFLASMHREWKVPNPQARF